MSFQFDRVSGITQDWNGIRVHPVFDGLQDEEIKDVLPFFGHVTLSEGELLLEEGHKSLDLYVVLSGQLEVIRRSESTSTRSFPWFTEKDFKIATITAGDAIGELSFAQGGTRSASVKCLRKAELLCLSPGQFDRLQDLHARKASSMMKNLLGMTGRKLKHTTDNEVSALKLELHNSQMRSRANLFFSYVIGLLCIYNLAIQQMTTLSLDSGRASMLSAALIVVFGATLGFMIRQSSLPLSFFGLTFNNWRKAILESCLWSAGVILLLIAIKWALVEYVPAYNHLTVFSFDPVHSRHLTFSFIVYGLHSPIQEFIARGVLQGSLENFFKGSNVTLRAILISNAIFSATHVHMLGGLLGVIVFIPGLFWGWLYARHGTLLGVCVSHILIGWTALFFLNLESLF